jgi:hypothetical protein
MPIKSFRGLIANESVDQISLHTNNGSVGYKIVKLQLYPNKPGDEHYLSAVKVYSVPQPDPSVTPPDEVTDFNDQTLLAAAFFQDNSDKAYPADLDVVFDNMTFNQDIYITHKSKSGTPSINYYIELEQVKLDLGENTVATLKDIRNIESSKQ